MISKYVYKGLTWVDLESPTDGELSYISTEFAIPEIVKIEMEHPSLFSKVSQYSDFIYMILHFPHVSNKEYRGKEKEIDFIIGKDFIITVHYEHVESLEEFAKKFEVNAILDKDEELDHAGYIFYHMIKSLYTHARFQLSEINKILKEIEKRIFEGKEGQMVQTISNINRTLLDFKQAFRFHRDVLISLEPVSKRFFGEDFNYYTALITSEYNKTISRIEGHKEILDDLRETNDSLLANKTEQTMKTLTIITFLISPVAVLSNIFVINTKFLDLEDTTQYYLVIGLMFVLSLAIFIYIRRKKWL